MYPGGSKQDPAHFVRLLIGVLCLNLLVLLLTVVLLVENRITHKESAQVVVTNLSSLLESDIVSTYEKVDLALQSVADEFNEYNESDRSGTKDWNQRLARVRDSLPVLSGLRATDASGAMIYGLDIKDTQRANVADRDYFLRLREDRNSGMLISSPLQGRVTGQWVLLLARRLSYKDGSFGGVVAASVPLDYFSKQFSSLKLHSKGSIGFRDNNLRIIVRYPGAAKGDGAVGASKISDDFKKALEKNPNIGSYNVSHTSIDSVSRLHHYRRNAVYGFYINVGFAHDDIYSAWYKLVWETSALLGLFVFGSLAFVWHMRRSIIEQQSVTDQLVQSENRYRDIVENQTDFVDRFLPGGILTYVNGALAKFAGMDPEELLGRSFYPFMHEEEREESIRLIESISMENRVVETEGRTTLPNGKVRWNRWTNTGIFDDDGFLIEYQAVGQDITERKRAEEEKMVLEQQLQHTQKLESLGVLSGGIAHDFNNILAIIMGYCSLTRMDYERAENNITEIEKAAERAAALCRQMLAYAGKAQLAKTQVNMRMLVDEMVTMLKATLPQNSVIKPELSTDIPTIEADASQLRQIVMNLIINASEAIGNEQGEIQVSLAKTTVIAGQSDKDYNSNTIPPGDYICLEVSDKGSGMNDEIKRRIFEPFFTTKFTGRGLGMSAVLGIINSHCGALQLFSQLGHGSTFKVFLPARISASANDENMNPSTSSDLWLGSGTILLVEDEDQIRLITKALLENFGFAVLEAVNGKEALELYQKNAAEITLVLTDMGMPVMDGYELIHELKKLKPELPIILSSGYGDAEVTSRIGSDNIAGLISKPSNPNQLRDVLKSALEGGR